MKEKIGNLKQVAKDLNINYNTAKSIIQTFRNENRVCKKSKRLIESKKALRHKKYMERMLNKESLHKLMLKVLQAELGVNGETMQGKNSFIKMELRKPLHTELSPKKDIVEVSFNNPKLGKISCGTWANLIPDISKRDIFYVQCDITEKYIDSNKSKKSSHETDVPIYDKTLVPPTLFDFHYYTEMILANSLTKVKSNS